MNDSDALIAKLLEVGLKEHHAKAIVELTLATAEEKAINPNNLALILQFLLALLPVIIPLITPPKG